jgi:hypothetical protein
MTQAKMMLYPQIKLGAFRDDPEENSQVTEKMPNKSVAFSIDGGYCTRVAIDPIKEAARLLGSISTPKKARAARRNGRLGKKYGKLGGRPKKVKLDAEKRA